MLLFTHHSVYLLTKPLCCATKVVALLFEMRVGLEAGNKALKAAESAVAALNGREDIVKEEVVISLLALLVQQYK